jgi:hypothetical protein
MSIFADTLTNARLVVAAAALLFAACGEPDTHPVRDHFPDSLIGTWVRVYPAADGLDSIVLRPGGDADGAPSSVAAEPLGRITSWRVGTWLGPLDLCFGDSRGTLSCQGYVLRTDTLALANIAQIVLVRATTRNAAVQPGDTVKLTRDRLGEVPPASRPGGQVP